MAKKTETEKKKGQKRSKRELAVEHGSKLMAYLVSESMWEEAESVTAVLKKIDGDRNSQNQIQGTN